MKDPVTYMSFKLTKSNDGRAIIRLKGLELPKRTWPINRYHFSAVRDKRDTLVKNCAGAQRRNGG